MVRAVRAAKDSSNGLNGDAGARFKFLLTAPPGTAFLGSYLSLDDRFLIELQQ